MNNAHISSDINHMCRQCAAYQMASVCLTVSRLLNKVGGRRKDGTLG